MEFKVFIFYFLSLVLVAAAVRVVTSRNPVHSALFLVLSFFTAGSLWLLLRAEFLAIALILVYVGAVMVLFLFVVMMLDINLERLRQGFWANLIPGLIVAGLMLVEMVTVLGARHFSADVIPPPPPAAADYSNTKELGRLIYTDYVFAFELASVILLVAIIAAIALTMRKRKDTKHTDPAAQIAVKRSDRIRLVSMKAEKE
jgi:NADH-quinone oxidoreductase subunit J